MSTTEALIAQMTAEANATGNAISKVVSGIKSLFAETAIQIQSGDDRLQVKIDEVTTKVEGVLAGLNANTLADLQKIQEIVTTDGKLLDSINTLQGLLTANQTAIGEAQAVEARLNQALVSAGADISALQGLSASIKLAAQALTDRVSATETRLTAVEGRVNAVEQDLSGLKSDLASVAVNAPAAIKSGFGAGVPVSLFGKTVVIDVA